MTTDHILNPGPQETAATLQHIRTLGAEQAISELDKYIARHPEDDGAYMLRGIKHWALGHRAEAIRDYHTAARLNPEGPAPQALKVTSDILGFFNPDLLNP